MDWYTDHLMDSLGGVGLMPLESCSSISWSTAPQVSPTLPLCFMEEDVPNDPIEVEAKEHEEVYYKLLNIFIGSDLSANEMMEHDLYDVRNDGNDCRGTPVSPVIRRFNILAASHLLLKIHVVEGSDPYPTARAICRSNQVVYAVRKRSEGEQEQEANKQKDIGESKTKTTEVKGKKLPKRAETKTSHLSAKSNKSRKNKSKEHSKATNIPINTQKQDLRTSKRQKKVVTHSSPKTTKTRRRLRKRANDETSPPPSKLIVSLKKEKEEWTFSNERGSNSKRKWKPMRVSDPKDAKKQRRSKKSVDSSGLACQCPICGKFYLHRSNLCRHQDIAHRNVRYSCHVCGLVYTRTDSLGMHLRKVHKVLE